MKVETKCATCFRASEKTFCDIECEMVSLGLVESAQKQINNSKKEGEGHFCITCVTEKFSKLAYIYEHKFPKMPDDKKPFKCKVCEALMIGETIYCWGCYKRFCDEKKDS